MSTDKELDVILSLIKTEKYYKGAHSERITGKSEAKTALNQPNKDTKE